MIRRMDGSSRSRRLGLHARRLPLGCSVKPVETIPKDHLRTRCTLACNPCSRPVLPTVTLLAGLVMASLPVAADPAPHPDWSHWRGPAAAGAWPDAPPLEELTPAHLHQRWTVEIGPGYSAPTVAEGRVLVSWRRTEPVEQEVVTAVDADSGELLWQYTYDTEYVHVDYPLGPRAAVTQANGRAFSVGTMGHVHAFDASSGEVLWAFDARERHGLDVPTWGVASAPVVFKDSVIIHLGGTEGAGIVAFDVASGEERWRATDDRLSYSTPALVETATGKPMLLVWTGDHLSALCPASGEVWWRIATATDRWIDFIINPVLSPARDVVFVGSYFQGGWLVQLSPDGRQASLRWHRKGSSPRRTEALHSLMSPPLWLGDQLVGFDSQGELRGIDPADGDRLWTSEDQVMATGTWANAYLVAEPRPDHAWIVSEVGDLVLGRFNADGWMELGRAPLIEPTTRLPQRQGTDINWSHPAFAGRSIFARNDRIFTRIDIGEDHAAAAEDPTESE